MKLTGWLLVSVPVDSLLLWTGATGAVTGSIIGATLIGVATDCVTSIGFTSSTTGVIGLTSVILV